MRSAYVLTFLFLLGLATSTRGVESSDTETVSRLGLSKHSLVAGIKQAAKTHGAPISAKFEFEDGKLWLSVYTAKAGTVVDAEHNTLIELKGEPNTATWAPDLEVFEDKKHLTRSAMQLTLLQQSKLDLAALVEKAAGTEKGVPYSAIPAVKNGRAILVVKFAAVDGASHAVEIAL